MELTRYEAIKLLGELQFHTAGSWENPRLEIKINRLIDIDFEEFHPESTEAQELLHKVLTALEEKDKILIVDDNFNQNPLEEFEIVKAETKKTSPKASVNGKKVDKPKKEPTAPKLKIHKERKAVDKFGCRIGTNCNKINEVLSKKPKTMKEILDESGVGPGHHYHLVRMIERGFVAKDGAGYMLTGNKKEKE